MFVQLLIDEKNTYNVLSGYDILISVPISKRRLKERGYNQSELIGRELSKKLKKEYAKNILYKTKNTIAQSTLNKEQREENAKGVYEIKNLQKVYNKKILLIDDIYTTGSTVNECSRILRQAHPEKIGVLTIAKD